MEQWRIKEVSEMTNVSVPMLRYYDKVGLLKPSVRSSNGYRWYTKQDLTVLQQILALRYFGFSLGDIKTMLQSSLDIAKHLHMQQNMLREQVSSLEQVLDTISSTLTSISSSKDLDLNDVVTLIERYRMTAGLKDSWAKKVLSETQFDQYMEIRSMHPPREFDALDSVIQKINNNEFGDPEGPDGIGAVEVLYDLLKKTKDTFEKQRHLNADIIKSIKAGAISEYQLTYEGNVWLAKASLAYWLKRWNKLYLEISRNVGKDPKGTAGKKIAKQWRSLLDEQFLGSPHDFAMGLVMWQDMGRQHYDLKQTNTLPSPKEQVDKLVDIMLDAKALNWVEKAFPLSLLEAFTKYDEDFFVTKKTMPASLQEVRLLVLDGNSDYEYDPAARTICLDKVNNFISSVKEP